MRRTQLPITEQSHPKTQDIDKASKKEIVKLLKECSLDIFTGWPNHQNVFDTKILAILKEVATVAAQFLKLGTQKFGIILSGCGTSGRIAFLISRKFNELAKAQKLWSCYRYIISGGDHAIMTSVESCEDDWNAGKIALVTTAEGLDKVLYVGISCGLSAPFIGGQVEHCLQHPEKFTPYLLGFNPAKLARNVAISGTDEVMLNIALKMEEKGNLLNPVIGPEPIAGSSRMKGGTATKMLLEAVFLHAHQLAVNDPTPIDFSEIFNTYEATLQSTHTKEADISSLVEMAGNSLIRGGSVVYLGWDSLGIMGMVDAAECVPTFGANHDDVRCFLKGGYELLRNVQGDLSAGGEKLKIGFEYFRKERCAKVSRDDTVIFILPELSSEQISELHLISNQVRMHTSNLAIIAINTNINWQKEEYTLGKPLIIHIALPNLKTSSIIYNKFLVQCTTEVSLKWVINAVSTGAHILKGKVFKNSMIDLKLSNKKLFERGVRIVTQFSTISSEEATKCLLKSIYGLDLLNCSIVQADVAKHVKKAGGMEKVIPLAILLARGFKVDLGLKMLQDCPIVRQCIDNCL